jgi:hypothetical protein
MVGSVLKEPQNQIPRALARSVQTRALYPALLGIVCVFLCLPVVICRYAPLVDYPSHLARAYILAHYQQVLRYQQNFVTTRERLPNLAIDIAGGYLLRFMDVTTFSRLFLASIVLLFGFGCHKLGCAIRGRPTMMAILCCFLIYNSMLFDGFVNYLFGLGMFCLTCAYYLEYRSQWTLLRLLFVGKLVFVSYVAHQSAYAFLAATFIVVAAIDYYAKAQLGTLLSAIGLIVPETVVYFTNPHHDLTTAIRWDGLRQKMIGFGAFVFTYSYWFDVSFVVMVIFLLLLALRLNRSPVVVRPTMIAGLLLFACYVLAPYEWLGSSPVDSRFIIPSLLLILLSFEWRIPRKQAKVILAACLVLFSFRVAVVWRTWRALDREIGEQVDMLNKALPEGASVYTAFLTVDSGAPIAKADRSFLHVSEYATITRRALIPTQFAKVGQQPLLFRSQPFYKAPLLQSPDWIGAMHRYQYAWSYALPDQFERVLQQNCMPIAKAGKGVLWRVLPADTSMKAKAVF